MIYISARDACLFFDDPFMLKDLIEKKNFPFYLRYPKGDFSGKLTGLYPEKKRNFLQYLDEIYFDFNEFNCVVNKKRAYLALKNLVVIDESLDSSGFKTQLAEKDNMIAALERELAACRDNPTTKTYAATQARQEKRLSEWKEAFKIMLKVCLQCRDEEPKPRTTPELKMMCARYNGSLDNSKIAFLRECLMECLGPEHVNTIGGPTIQG